MGVGGSKVIGSWLVDVITIASYQCKALLGLFSLNSKKNFLLSSSVRKLGIDGFIFSALKDSDNHWSPRRYSLKLIYRSYLCMYGHVPLLMST